MKNRNLRKTDIDFFGSLNNHINLIKKQGHTVNSSEAMTNRAVDK